MPSNETLDIKEIVKDTTSYFMHYRDQELWYKVIKKTGVKEEWSLESRAVWEVPIYEKIFEFPVPISDTGSGVFPYEIKTITLMRWVRKHLETMKEWKE